MIKYKLECEDCRDKFDSWFSSSKEFDKLYIRVLALSKSMGDLEPTEIVNRLKKF